jgi:CheY-like chemotaxis protein
MSNVLLVDDIDVVRLTLRKFLERGGHQVRECASAAEAVEAMRASKPDVVITDLWMPGRDGLSLIRELRSNHAGLPVIAITGGAPSLPQALSLEEAKQAGADRVLMKPVGLQELLTAVREGLERKSVAAH